MMGKRLKKAYLFLLLVLGICFCGCSAEEILQEQGIQVQEKNAGTVADLDKIPDFSGEAYVEIGDNIPDFDKKDMTDKSFEDYSPLDSLGRCKTAYANIGRDLMPTEKREEISAVHPSGWHSVRYNCVEGRYLYNRCHLIGFQLAGENANKKNLITGTRYMNVDGMLPFENKVAEYVKETDNHVLYRVTPVYEGEELVARGVRMEAYSVEDKGKGVCFDVFVYNSQPGVEIDYATGESRLGSTTPKKAEKAAGNKAQKFVLNTNTKKFHLPSCSSAEDTKKENKKTLTGTRAELEEKGYEACGRCLK